MTASNDNPLKIIAGIIILIIVGLFALMISGCNPVKQVLNDESKKRQVWVEGALDGWCVNDSVFVSDTTIVLDTLHSIDYVSDTITVDNVKYIEKLSYKTIEKKITIRDTTVVTDNSRIKLQGELIDKQRAEMFQLSKNLKESEALEKQRRKERNKWRLYFFISVGAFVAWLLRKPIFKLISPLKFITMKLFIIILSTFFLASCWSNDNRPPRELPQRVFAEESVPVYDSVSQWSVEQKQYIKVWGIARYENVPIKEFEVVPNGEQVKKFAKDQGQSGLNWIGILIAVGIAAAGVFGAGYFESGKAKGITRVVAVLAAVAIGFFTNKPANIAQNNAKTITEKQLKHYQAIDPELNYFWDSVYKASVIIGTKK